MENIGKQVSNNDNKIQDNSSRQQDSLNQQARHHDTERRRRQDNNIAINASSSSNININDDDDDDLQQQQQHHNNNNNQSQQANDADALLLTTLTDAALNNLSQLAALQERCQSQQTARQQVAMLTGGNEQRNSPLSMSMSLSSLAQQYHSSPDLMHLNQSQSQSQSQSHTQHQQQQQQNQYHNNQQHHTFNMSHQQQQQHQLTYADLTLAKMQAFSSLPSQASPLSHLQPQHQQHNQQHQQQQHQASQQHQYLSQHNQPSFISNVGTIGTRHLLPTSTRSSSVIGSHSQAHPHNLANVSRCCESALAMSSSVSTSICGSNNSGGGSGGFMSPLSSLRRHLYASSQQQQQHQQSQQLQSQQAIGNQFSNLSHHHHHQQHQASQSAAGASTVSSSSSICSSMLMMNFDKLGHSSPTGATFAALTSQKSSSSPLSSLSLTTCSPLTSGFASQQHLESSPISSTPASASALASSTGAQGIISPASGALGSSSSSSSLMCRNFNLSSVSPAMVATSGATSSSGFASPMSSSSLLGLKQSQLRLNNMQIKHKFGHLGQGSNQFNSPHGFCLGIEQEIIVADTNNHRICIFDKNGTFIRQFGIPGKDDGQLWNPRKVVIMPSPPPCHYGLPPWPFDEPLFIVCDRGAERSRMQVFTPDGRFIKKIPLSFIDIVAGVAISKDGSVAAVDSVQPTVYLISLATSALDYWFDCSDHMKEPSDVAIKLEMVPATFDKPRHARAEFFICDFKGHCVVVFGDDGVCLRKIGHEFLTAYPNGIDLSDDGDILVGDSHGNRFHVVVFDRYGNFVSQFECPHVKVSRCCGLKITREGYIVTLAKNNHHVLVLDTIHI